jgi:L-fuculose-phosphate aldolase
MEERALRELMCDVGRQLWSRGLVGATEGNLSARLAGDRILCTPSGQSKGHLKPQDLVVIDRLGAPIDKGSPSSEIKMHVRIYAKRPDCRAVVHAHPPIATAFALAGESIPDNVLPESMVVLGSVANVPFCMPGTDEVPNTLEPFLANHKTFLLSNHGAVTLGKDLLDAYHRMERLERIAQMLMHAKTLGEPRPVPAAAFDQLKVWLNGKL